MIEIRWRRVKDNELVTVAIELLTGAGPDVFVLEQRTIQNPQEIGLQQPIWSQWHPVGVHGIEGLDFEDSKNLPLGVQKH